MDIEDMDIEGMDIEGMDLSVSSLGEAAWVIPARRAVKCALPDGAAAVNFPT